MWRLLIRIRLPSYKSLAHLYSGVSGIWTKTGLKRRGERENKIKLKVLRSVILCLAYRTFYRIEKDFKEYIFDLMSSASFVPLIHVISVSKDYLYYLSYLIN